MKLNRLSYVMIISWLSALAVPGICSRAVFGDDAKPAVTVPPSDKSPQVVYESGFDKKQTDGWSVVHHTRPLNVQKSADGKLAYLGEFHNDLVRLDLPKLPPHQFLIVECDFIALKTWGGSEVGDDKDGPDLFTVRLDGGPTLLHSSFSSFKAFPQSYPDTFPAVRHEGLTGATQLSPPGMPVFKGEVGATNALYHLRLIVSHSADQAALEFVAALTESLQENLTIDNESWALANVRVSVSTSPLASVDEKRFQILWSSLDGSDAVAANQAVWELVCAGPAVIPLIQKHLQPGVNLPGVKDAPQWIAALDAEDFSRPRRGHPKTACPGHRRGSTAAPYIGRATFPRGPQSHHAASGRTGNGRTIRAAGSSSRHIAIDRWRPGRSTAPATAPITTL